MRASRGKDLVSALALCAALGLGGFLFLRSSGLTEARWSDGSRRFASETGDEVRHAVWEPPVAIEGPGEGTDPAVSPDGRWLVFVSGERGLNSELWLAELVDGRALDPRPLAALDTPADELAPAFGEGALYFASDRPGGAGGLDLWRAPYADGVFGAPEALAPGLNSAADETDPAPVPGSGELVFASNRAHADLDLYLATPDASGFLECTPLAALNGPGDEREPCLARDGRSLVLASDRAGSFDLYRALRFDDGWHAPRALEPLNSAGEERGPWLASEGFTLWFQTRTEAGAPRILRAASREIFREPVPAVTLEQWLMLLGLVALALLAQLAKRWRGLDFLYKCALVSLLLHLLLMLYLRSTAPEETSYETGTEEGPSFRVRLAPAEASEGEGGLTGPLAPTRERLAPAAELAPSPAPRLTAPELAEAPAPRPANRAAPEAEAPPETALAAPREADARAAQPAPELALPAPGPTAPAPTTVAADPSRAAGPQREDATPAPRSAELATLRPSDAALARGPERTRLTTPAFEAPSGASDARLATPREPAAPSSAAAPPLALPAPEVTARRGEEAVLAREATAPPGTGRALPEAAPGPLVTSALAPASSSATEGPTRAPLQARVDVGRAEAPEMRAPPETRGSGSESAPLAFDALGDAPAATARTVTPLAGPAREETDAGGARSESPAPARAPAEGLVARAAPANGPAPAPRSVGPSAEGPTPAPELRRAAGDARDARAAPSAPSASFDAMAGMGLSRAPTPALAATPERAPLAGPSALAPARPEPSPTWSAPSPAPLERALEEAPRPRLAETPYQNRFGEQKLRALEEFGGTAETEHAVAAGLAYLARIQGKGGEWGQRSDAHAKYLDVRVGKSALALLAFLGAGHVPGGESEHAAVAERAVSWLLASQDPDTGHFGRSCSYGHGIATYALAECFALTRDERLREPLERALEEILRHQSDVGDPRFFGGWGYYFADGHVWSGDEWPRTSVTAWQVMALESARLGGLEVPDAAFDGARAFLLATWDPRAGAFRYDHDPERLSSGYPILPASTPAALFALALLGVDPAARELAPARRFVLTRMPDGYRYTGDADFVRRARGNLYFWYYGTLAMFRAGGSEWEGWNGALKETLLPAQAEDGSWRPIDTYAEYAGDEDEERTYTTAMCVLSLEVYYRYFTPLLRVR